MRGILYGTSPCRCDPPPRPGLRVAVTGGPGAGKTAVLEMAARGLCRHVAILPEAASIVFGGGFPRRSKPYARRAAQRAIFHVQRELEALVDGEGEARVVLCDRGTIDGVAYWPGRPADYYTQLGIEREQELSRYAGVVHLRVPPPGEYNHQNPLRTETPEQARAIDERIVAAWAGHPRRVTVEPDDDFVRKAGRALAAVAAFLPECCRAHAHVPVATEGGPPGSARSYAGR